jgi:type I restriction enzyme S subunit
MRTEWETNSSEGYPGVVMKQGWEIKKVGDVCEIYNGGTPETSKKQYWDGNHLWITPKDMGKLAGIYVDNTERKITDAGLQNSSAKMLPINSIILSSRAPIGHLAINSKELATNQGCKGLVPKKNLNPLYLYYFLKNSVRLLNRLGSGTTFKELSGTKLAGVEIPLPPLPEQQRIVAILDEAFTAIDAAKANVEKNLQNSHELFETYLNNIFANPGEGWVDKKLGDICENLDFKRVPVTKRDRYKGQYPYYGASGIVDYVNDFLFDEDLLLVSEDGANLLARTYPIAFSITGKAWVNNHAHVLKFAAIETQKYVEYFLNSIKVDEYVNGMAQPKLNQKMLNSITIHLPELCIQKSIICKFNTLYVETKKQEAILQQKVDNLEELKKSLLTKAFNGELTEG